MNGGYDEGYQRCSCFWGVEPGSVLRALFQVEKSFVGCTVLDAGCGEGKNAVYLARLGAKVDAVDVSAAAIDNGKRMWGDEPNVRWIVADIRDLRLGARYDVTIAYGLLHCLRDPSEVATVVSALQRATATDGYNVLCAFNRRHQELDNAHPSFNPCLLEHREYLSLYASWQLLVESDADLTETHPHNGIEHTHSLTPLLAKKMT